MHLLKIEHGGSLQDSDEAVDLGQPPGDIVILTSADTEIAMLSDAVASLNAERAGADTKSASGSGATACADSDTKSASGASAKSAKGRDAKAHAATSPAHRPEFRIASTLSLGHPFSVDRYIEDTISGARLVIARLLGGSAYWSYGTQRLTELAATGAVKLALIAGDARGDPELDRLSNLAPGQCARLAAYLDAGGPQNARGFLMAAMDILNGTDDAPPPRQLLRAGIYWPDTEAPDLASVASNWEGGAPTAAIIFYRALVQAGDLAPVDQVIASCQREGLNPLPLFCASLKDPESAAIIESLLGQTGADIILNMTSFAVSDPAAMSAQPAIAPQRAGDPSAAGAANAANATAGAGGAAGGDSTSAVNGRSSTNDGASAVNGQSSTNDRSSVKSSASKAKSSTAGAGAPVSKSAAVAGADASNAPAAGVTAGDAPNTPIAHTHPGPLKSLDAPILPTGA